MEFSPQRSEGLGGWVIGVLECWEKNLKCNPDHYSIIPPFHYSTESDSSLRLGGEADFIWGVSFAVQYIKILGG
jgi:hypothetical protein